MSLPSTPPTLHPTHSSKTLNSFSLKSVKVPTIIFIATSMFSTSIRLPLLTGTLTSKLSDSLKEQFLGLEMIKVKILLENIFSNQQDSISPEAFQEINCKNFSPLLLSFLGFGFLNQKILRINAKLCSIYFRRTIALDGQAH